MELNLKVCERAISRERVKKVRSLEDIRKLENKYLGVQAAMKDLIEEGFDWSSEIIMAKGYAALSAMFGSPVQNWPRTVYNYYESASKIRGNPEIYDDKIKSYRIYNVFKNLYLTLVTK